MGAELDPHAQVEAFRREVDGALDRGCTGLRVAAHISALARHAAEHRRELHVFERLADGLAGSTPLTGMCLYDAALGEVLLGPVLLLHPLQHHGSRLPLAHLSGRGAQLTLSGEVDCSNADHLLPALVDLAGAAHGELVLDLSALAFLDIAGARVLARAVASVAELGVQLRLTGVRRSVARCLDMFPLATGEGWPA
jgi:anti-anti-sigma factor